MKKYFSHHGGFILFWRDKRGAFAVSFVLLSGLLLSLAALGIEGTRYVLDRARLSDAMEQAALALSAEDNGVAGNARNQKLASDYFKAWMQHEKRVVTPVIKINNGVSSTNGNLSWVEYRVSGQISEDSWFSSSLFPSFGKQVTVGGNGAARKYRSDMDVVFAVDFSESMREGFVGDENRTKIDELKSVVMTLSTELFSFDKRNKVGFVPFTWGIKSLDGKYCYFPFVSNTGKKVPDNVLQIMPDHVALDDFRRVMSYIDYQATLNSIPKDVTDFLFPYSKVDSDAPCLNIANNAPYTVPLTSSLNDIKKINSMNIYGFTLISSGMIGGTQVLSKGTAAKKVLVIVSDGMDEPRPEAAANIVDISQKLMQMGLCNKIREALTTSSSTGKIAFIGINYDPSSDWKSCVGESNYFEPKTVDEFRNAMRRAVFEEVGHNTLKD